MKRILILFLIFIQFISCIKEIDFIENDFEQLPVANCFFTNDTCFWLHLSMVQAVNDSSDNNYISDAKITISSDNQTHILNYLDSGKYYSDFYPEINKNYTLNINYQNNNLTSENIIPQPAQILWIDTLLTNVYDNEEQIICNSTNIKIQDKPSEENYYELSIQIKTIFPDTTLTGDTSYQFFNSTFATTQIPSISNEKQKWNSNSLFFRDNFADENYIMEFPINFSAEGAGIFCVDGVCYAEGEFLFILKTVSKDYYYYRKSMIMASEFLNTAGTINSLTNLSFTNKPVKIYSNIINGYGIFAGYSVDTFCIVNPRVENNFTPLP